MIEHRVAIGRWERLHRGVFRIGGAPDRFEASSLAACFASGPLAVVSHTAAAWLWRLDGATEGSVVISAPRRVRVPGVAAHTATDLCGRDVSRIGPIPVTTAARTLVDLAAVVDSTILETAVDDALRRGLTSVARLRSTYGRLARRGRHGIGAVRELLDRRPDATAVPDSPLEAKAQRLLRSAGLPPAVLHYRVRVQGRTIAVIDLAYPAHKVAIELDGYRYHHGRARWQSDLTRMNALTALGWQVLRFSDEDCTRRPDDVVATIVAALESHRTTSGVPL